MGREAAGRRTDSGENTVSSEIKVTLTIPLDAQGCLNTAAIEAAFLVNGELPPDFAEIVAGARAQLAGVIDRVKTPQAEKTAPEGGTAHRSRFTADIPDFYGNLVRKMEDPNNRPPDRAAVRPEYNAQRFVEAVMDLPEGERRQLKGEFVRLLNSGSLPGTGLLAEEQRRTGFTDPAVQSAFRNFLWGKLLRDRPEEKKAFEAYYSQKRDEWWDRRDGKEPATVKAAGGFQPTERGLSPEQEARLVERWLAGAE
jgi:hypothetical protein